MISKSMCSARGRDIVSCTESSDRAHDNESVLKTLNLDQRIKENDDLLRTIIGSMCQAERAEANEICLSLNIQAAQPLDRGLKHCFVSRKPTKGKKSGKPRRANGNHVRHARCN
jgi:hypothetical protein